MAVEILLKKERDFYWPRTHTKDGSWMILSHVPFSEGLSEQRAINRPIQWSTV